MSFLIWKVGLQPHGYKFRKGYGLTLCSKVYIDYFVVTQKYWTVIVNLGPGPTPVNVINCKKVSYQFSSD